MARKKSHIQADMATTQAWMRITGLPEWKLMLEDLCMRVLFNPVPTKDALEVTLQQGEQRLLRTILGKCSPGTQQAILDRLTEEALSDD